MTSIEMLYNLAIAVLGSAGFYKFAETALGFIKDNKKKSDRTKLEQGLRQISKIYSKMSDMEFMGANRIVLFAGHNNGGIPRLTCGFWVSSIFSHVAERFTHKAKEYSNIPVDSTYVTMLIETQSKDYVRYRVKEMPQCQLKKYYEAEGVQDSIIVFLGVHEHKFMYMSMANYEREFDDNEVTNLVLEAQNIKTMFDYMSK